MIALAGLDLTDKLVVCVGGGSVAQRRIARLRAAGARVRLVAPVATPALAALAASGDIAWMPRGFVAEDLDDAWFCHTATGSASVDAAVVAAADARRVWCVNAGHGGKGTARLAAETASGDVMVGVVSTAAPILAVASPCATRSPSASPRAPSLSAADVVRSWGAWRSSAAVPARST